MFKLVTAYGELFTRTFAPECLLSHRVSYQPEPEPEPEAIPIPMPTTPFINTLPVEILIEIFKLARMGLSIASMRTHDSFYIRSKMTVFPPLSLIHVCRHWRAVALSDHSLWTSLSADRTSISAMEGWLSFSQQAKLRLHMSCHPRPTSGHSLVAKKAMLQLLVTEAHRWDYLFVNIDPILAQELIDILPSLSHSPLRVLEAELVHHDTPKTIAVDLLSAITQFQSLRELILVLPRSEFDICALHADIWSRLAVIYIDVKSLPTDETLRFLSRCTAATKCTLLAKQWPAHQPVGDDDHIVHADLLSLKINGTHDDAMRFLRRCTFPALVALELEMLRGRSHDLDAFFNRSHCPLGFFRAENLTDAMGDDDIVGCLATPYLSTVAKVMVSVECLHDGRLESIRACAAWFPKLMVWYDPEKWFTQVGWTDGYVWKAWKKGSVMILGSEVPDVKAFY